jgi:hypothetical protein
VIALYLDAYNRKDVAAMLACLADSVRFEHRAGGRVAASADGKAAFAVLARAGVAAFAERRQTATRRASRSTTPPPSPPIRQRVGRPAGSSRSAAPRCSACATGSSTA